MATRRVAAKKTRSVRAEKFSSMKDFQKSTKKGGGSEAIGKIAFIPEEPILVRFLDEPQDWIGYYEHYMGSDADVRYLPCTGGDCCEESDDRPSYRYLANAVITDERKGAEVKALKIPKGLGEHLGKLAARYNTILDRDYELSREGQKFETRYMAVPEAPSKFNIRRYENKKHDLLDLLEEIASGADAEDEEEDERPSSRTRSRPAKTRDDDVWDDEDDEDDDEDEGFSPKRRATPKKSVAKKTVTRKTTAKPASTTRRIKRR